MFFYFFCTREKILGAVRLTPSGLILAEVAVQVQCTAKSHLAALANNS